MLLLIPSKKVQHGINRDWSGGTDKERTKMLTSDAFARSFLEITPIHLWSESITGSPEMTAKWWSTSSRACSGKAVVMVFDITSAKCVDGCAWSHKTSTEVNRRINNTVLELLQNYPDWMRSVAAALFQWPPTPKKPSRKLRDGLQISWNRTLSLRHKIPRHNIWSQDQRIKSRCRRQLVTTLSSTDRAS